MSAIVLTNGLVAVLALLAAFAWVWSAQAFVKAPPGVDRGATIGGQIYDDDRRGRRFNVLDTLRLQSGRNRIAAGLAAAAALAQAAASLLPVILPH